MSVTEPKSIHPSAIRQAATPVSKCRFPIKRPELFPGVVPPRKRAPVLAMDGIFAEAFNFAAIAFGSGGEFEGFPGYQYLAQLMTRPEFRAFADTYSSELTREWIKIQSTETDDDKTAEKITELTKAVEEMDLKGLIQKAAVHDYGFGRGQIAIEIDGHDQTDPAHFEQ